MLVSLLGCTVTPVQEIAWPENIPPRELYEQAWRADEQNRAVQDLDGYLRWVLRFYQGWPVYDYGWLDTTRDVLASADNPGDRNILRAQLFEMGKRISIEWSKDSDHRYIRTPTISAWGSALREATDRGEVAELMDRVFNDIDLLAARQLKVEEISLERYYTLEEEDFF